MRPLGALKQKLEFEYKTNDSAAGMISSYQNISILGSRVNILSMKEVVGLIDRWIGDNNTKCRQIVVTGFHGIWEAHKNPELKKILNSADLWVPDGIAPVWCARYRGFSGIQRTPGAEIMKAFFEKANNKGYSSFFYGDTEETLNALNVKVNKEYPGHNVVGTFSPPFRSLTHEEDEQVVKMINDARPDVLWVALGTPKQDRWIFEHKEKLKVPIAIGVGAAFRFLSGHVKKLLQTTCNTENVVKRTIPKGANLKNFFEFSIRQYDAPQRQLAER